MLTFRDVFFRGQAIFVNRLRNAQFDAIVPVLGVATMGVSMSLRSPARLENIGREKLGLLV